ncbi:hypothetical protein [Catellatospora sp. NPDC049133]|uniref:hypothetical protein n=1 Tax=Catellatospora sp. NPDC049133 TaxID=3155499 RepID=UPI0033CC763A
MRTEQTEGRALALADAGMRHVGGPPPQRRQTGGRDRLVLTRWPDSDDIVAIVTVNAAEMKRLKPGFATWHGDDMAIPAHRRAHLEYGPRGISLYVAGDLIADGTGPAGALPESCLVGLVTPGLLSGAGRALADEFITLLELGLARVAEAPALRMQTVCSDVVAAA